MMFYTKIYMQTEETQRVTKAMFNNKNKGQGITTPDFVLEDKQNSLILA